MCGQASVRSGWFDLEASMRIVRALRCSDIFSVYILRGHTLPQCKFSSCRASSQLGHVSVENQKRSIPKKEAPVKFLELGPAGQAPNPLPLNIEPPQSKYSPLAYITVKLACLMFGEGGLTLGEGDCSRR